MQQIRYPRKKWITSWTHTTCKTESEEILLENPDRLITSKAIESIVKTFQKSKPQDQMASLANSCRNV